jgi:hypothetical protein
MTTSNPHHHDTQQRINSSKRTMINNFDPLVDNNPIISHHSSRPSKSKPESGSEELYPTLPNNLTQKHRVRQGMGDYADDESKIKSPIERAHRLSSPSNNSAIRLQQQGMGDHYHTNTKQHKSRSKTPAGLNRKYQRLIEQQDLESAYDDKTAYRWRLMIYILIIFILAFVIYRFLLAVWPKPRKTFMEQLIDDFSNFFTP